MSAFIALVLASFRRETQHRLQSVMRIIGGLVEILARISIWQAVYAVGLLWAAFRWRT